jgi:tetratricopeptide (TPR) repeat protein
LAIHDSAADEGAKAATPAPDFFISRAGPDSAIAQRIAHILEDAGRRVVIQDWDFKNRAFMERMHAALTSGARTIALLSPDYLQRDHCAVEWQNAIADDPLNRRSRLIVLRIRPCDPPGLLKSLAFWDLVPLLGAPGFDGLLRDAVLASVREGRHKPPAPIAPFFAAAKPILHAEIKPTANFTGREAALATIDKALASGAQAAITQPAAVHGLGGIGKSTLAREFAWRAGMEGRYAGVWWLRGEKTKDAASWDGIEQGLADLRGVLYPGAEPLKDRAEAARSTLRFLSTGGFEKPWLLVYDNVDDKEILDAWAPPTNVQVLVTSRLGRWGKQVAPVEVEEWTLPEAIRYLRDASGRGDLSDADLTAIAEKLGRLPLALSHAAAYLLDNTAITAADYIDELSARMRQAPEGVAYKASVFATFGLAIGQAEAKAQGAKAVITFAAFLAPDNIPEELFTQPPDIYPPALQPLAASLPRLREAISALDRLSLVDFDAAERVFSVHRLVQAAARDALEHQAGPAKRGFLAKLFGKAPKEVESAAPPAAWIEAAVKAIEAADPGVEFEHWPAYERLFPHARIVADLASDCIGEPLAEVNERAADYLDDHAAYAESEPLRQRALKVREKALCPDHPDVAQSLNNLAELYRVQGKYNLAEPLYQRGLAIIEKALGPDHAHVGSVCNNLAALYQAQGKYELAEPLHQRALTIRKKALGSDHPDRATSLNNLAGLYRAEGKYELAEPLFQHALAVLEKALGPDHPNVGTALNNLAELHSGQGKHDLAEPLFQRALVVREKALGPDHPDVAQTLNNLAALYRAQGKYDLAEPLFQRSLAVFEKMLGPDHPNVGTACNNLAALYQAQGKYDLAEPLFQRSLAVFEKALAPDHPNVGAACNTLAMLYQAQGKYDLAEALFQRALPVLERALGPDHPDVGGACNNLAELYRAQGAYDCALPLCQRALSIREKALGSDHPDVAQSLNNLAVLHFHQGNFELASPLNERALALWQQALGSDHPQVAYALNNLANIHLAQEDYERAEQRYQRALAIFERALGLDHPNTNHVSSSLATCREAAMAAAGTRDGAKISRNHPCPCGSGKRYKHCCGKLA